MGDFYQSIIPLETAAGEAAAVAQRGLNFLFEKQIVRPDMADNVLSADAGYSPGANWQDAADPDVLDEYYDDFEEMVTNGLAVELESKEFVGDVEKIQCPGCRFELEEDNFWEEEVQCPSCGISRPNSEYIYVCKSILGEVGFTFYNWPEFSDTFLSDFSQALGKKVDLVSGKI